MACKWWGGWLESEKVETMLKCLLNELHADETSFRDMRSPFREANKRLISEEREDPLTTSNYLETMRKSQASLMQLVTTAVSTAVTGMQILT